MGKLEQFTATATNMATDLARGAYKTVIFRLQSAYHPVEFSEGPDDYYRRTIRGEDGLDHQVVLRPIAVPLTINPEGKVYRAARTNTISRVTDDEHPFLLITMEDTNQTTFGDEALAFQFGGGALDYIPADRHPESLVWRIYLQPNDKGLITAAGVGKPNSQSAASLTASDIIDWFQRKVAYVSDSQISVRRDHLITAIQMITDKSPSLRARWNLLAERSRFLALRAQYPEYVALLLREMVAAPKADFVELVDDLRFDRVTNWEQLMQKLDKMEKVSLGGNAHISTMLLHALTLFPRTEEDALEVQIQDVPASLLVGPIGLALLNTYITGWKDQIEPRLKALGANQVEVQVEVMNVLEAYVSGKKESYKEAHKRLKRRLSRLKAHTGKTVDAEVLKLGDNIKRSLQGAFIEQNRGNGRDEKSKGNEDGDQ